MKRQIKQIAGKIFHLDQTIKINDLFLTIDSCDYGGTQYNSKGSFEELAIPLYTEINEIFKPDMVLDIGANYGFTGLVFARRFPDAEIVLIEPCKKLCNYIHQNFKLNSFSNIEVINAICDDTIQDRMRISINPQSSQDNRVIPAGKNWKTETVPSVTIDGIMRSKVTKRFVFIKVDTQGYEERVLRGGTALLEGSNWLVKTEFAPHWLRSQGTDPARFLKELIDRFHVVELPKRFRFKGDSLFHILSNRIAISEVEDFINYIQSLNRNMLGWCDLMVYPKQLDIKLICYE